MRKEYRGRENLDVLFIGAFAPKAQAGNWLFGIYIFGAILELIAAKVLRMMAFRGPESLLLLRCQNIECQIESSFGFVYRVAYSKALLRVLPL